MIPPASRQRRPSSSLSIEISTRPLSPELIITVYYTRPTNRFLNQIPAGRRRYQPRTPASAALEVTERSRLPRGAQRGLRERRPGTDGAPRRPPEPLRGRCREPLLSVSQAPVTPAPLCSAPAAPAGPGWRCRQYRGAAPPRGVEAAARRRLRGGGGALEPPRRGRRCVLGVAPRLSPAVRRGAAAPP